MPITNDRIEDRSDLDVGASVGRAMAHDSAVAHVRGAAVYVDDLPEPSGTVHVVPGYADMARGRIDNLDLEAVRNAPGVLDVLTAASIPEVNDCSPVFGDDPILADGEIFFHGQPLFAVVAETRDQARRAARLSRLEADRSHPIVAVDEGVEAGGDLMPPYVFERGSPDLSIKVSEHRLEGRFRIGGQEHFYLEGQVAIAFPGEGDEIRILSSTQHPTEIQHLVAAMLGIPDAAVVCECRRMGGGFGGKESQAAQWACLAALAARRTGRPAKIRLDRDDDMRMTGKRHDFRVDWRCGFDHEGLLAGVDFAFSSRCGHSADLSMAVNDRTMFHADNAYFYPECRILSRRIRTDTVSNTAFRGFGGPQGMFAAERMMDAIAIHLDRDPFEVRMRNLYAPGRDITPFGAEPQGYRLIRRIMRRLVRTGEYTKRRQMIARFNAAAAERAGHLRKGISLTPVKFGISFTLKHLNQAGALVNVFGDGSVQVNHGGTEMGQGLHTKITQVVAEEFGIDIGRVRITATRTDKVPNTSATAASVGSDLNGMAASRAAGVIRRRLARLAARLFQVGERKVSFAEGQVRVGEESIPFERLTQMAVKERVSLSATGHYATPGMTWDRETVSGNPFYYYAMGAACSEVSVDITTGEMRIDRVDILHDVGRSLNPAIDIGQIEGGFVQGAGWLTTEELAFDEQGRLRTHAPSTYKIPTCSDVPTDFRVSLFEQGRNRMPTIHRSKAVGEPPLMLAISVFSAITHAIASLASKRLPPLDAPATPEAILRAVAALGSEAG